MDEADKAQKDFEAYEEARRKSGPPPKDAEETGYCLYCGEPVEKGRRWCDFDCMKSWEKEHSRRK